jgi:ribose transport system substrate-binding protein
VLGAVLLLALTACGSPRSAGGPQSGPASPAGRSAQDALSEQERPLTTIADAGPAFDATVLSGKTVYYVPLALKADYFQLVNKILVSTLAEVGVTVQACDGQANPSGISSCLDQAVTRKADAIITDYIPYQLAPTSFAAVQAAGIPVYISGESAPEGVASTPTLRFDNPDSYQFATMEGIMNAVIADSDGRGNVLFLTTEDDPAVARAGKHAQEYVATACPDCVLTTKRVSIATIQNVPSLVSSTLVQNPAITYVVPQYDSYLPPAISGIQSAGKTRDVKLASANASLANLPPVKANPQVMAAVGHDTAYSAWSMADAALRMMAGQAPPDTYPVPVRAFTKSNVGDLDLTPDGEASGGWHGDARSYQDSFRRLWGQT